MSPADQLQLGGDMNDTPRLRSAKKSDRRYEAVALKRSFKLSKPVVLPWSATSAY